MSDSNLEARLSRLNAQAAAPRKAKIERPAPVSRTERRQARLARALNVLAEAGIKGNYAYPLPFLWLTRIGLILKPLHFRSWTGLTIFALMLFTVLFLGVATLANWIGYFPAPLARMLDVGPAMFLGVNIGFSLTFAAVFKRHAEKIGLPRWQDL